MKVCFVMILAPIVLALASSSIEAAEKFQNLNCGQVRGKLAGMEFTDCVHWRDIFARNGTLAGYPMGRRTVVKWSVQKDQLCLDCGKDPGSGCYSVRMSGNNVELRSEGTGLSNRGATAEADRPTMTLRLICAVRAGKELAP